MRIVNGCQVSGAQVTDVRVPRSPLVCLQIVEYLRAFLTGRTGWSRLNSLLIIIEERSFQRYRRGSDLLVLAAAAVLENVGFRQWHAAIRARAVWSLLKGRRSWGEMTRAGFTPPPALLSEAGVRVDVDALRAGPAARAGVQ